MGYPLHGTPHHLMRDLLHRHVHSVATVSGCQQFYCLRQCTSKERPTVSQSVSQAGKQSVRQSVGQAGRQTDRQKKCYSVADCDYKHRGTLRAQEHSVVEWSNTWLMKRLVLVPIPSGSAIAGSADRPLSPLIYLTLVQILLTTNCDPPPIPPPPKKKWYPVSGG